MAEPRFYELEAYGGGRISDYYANGTWPRGDVRNEEDPLQCPHCGAYLTMIGWGPPHRLVLEDFKRFGDFLFVPGGDFFVSARFVEAYGCEELSGIATIHPPAQVVEIRGRGKMREPPPTYHHVEIMLGGGDIDDEASGIIRTDPEFCPRCRSGGFKSATYGCDGNDRLVLKPGSWTGADIFRPMGMTGAVLTSQRFVDFCVRHKFTNVSFIPGEHACEYFGLKSKKPDPSVIITPAPPPVRRRQVRSRR